MRIDGDVKKNKGLTYLTSLIQREEQNGIRTYRSARTSVTTDFYGKEFPFGEGKITKVMPAAGSRPVNGKLILAYH